MSPDELSRSISAVRHFNRVYTRRIGVLNEGLSGSRYSLSEARVLYELAKRNTTTAADLARDLDLDPGYLSRIVAGFHRSRLISKAPSKRDGRERVLRITERGSREFAKLDAGTRREIEALLAGITASDRERMLAAMRTIEEVSAAGRAAGEPAATALVLRPHRPGDIGWVVHRHGVVYADEYGWDESFEALVARILAEYVRTFDARRERSWIAEMDGEIVGSVFVMRGNDRIAKLRLLLVEPKARGTGLGTRLVDECILFARRAGYETLSLWTNDVLHSARRIYERAGFTLVNEEPHHSFGHDLVGQTWELDLRRETLAGARQKERGL